MGVTQPNTAPSSRDRIELLDGGLVVFGCKMSISQGPRGKCRLRKAHVFVPSNKKLGNSHQNSHSDKIKMAADLAAEYTIDFI